MTVAVWVVVAALVLLLTAVGVMYNRFVRQRTLCDEAWGDIDVELTRRHDLIPHLVETVKGYAAHERDVLESLVRARESAVAHQSDAPAPRGEAEASVDSTLQQVLVRAQAYPDLKASAGFLALQQQLAMTEDRIAAARRFYNGNVRAYNSRVRTLPSTLVAAACHFQTREFFQLAHPSDAAAPVVDVS